MSEIRSDVLCVRDCRVAQVQALLHRYGMEAVQLPADQSIPGSYWGEREAGLCGCRLFVRMDTPLHSVLHEACHFICMDAARRSSLQRDAGGDHAEENAVCYLQVLLSDEFKECGRARMWRDMDAWGYTFRLGSSQAWFEHDAQDACAWLQLHGLIDAWQRPTGRKRGEADGPQDSLRAAGGGLPLNDQRREIR